MGKNCHNLVYLFMLRQTYENFMQKLPNLWKSCFLQYPSFQAKITVMYVYQNKFCTTSITSMSVTTYNYVGKCCPFRTIYVTQYLKLMLACLFIPCTFIVFCESSHVRTTSGWDLVIFISSFLLTLLYNLECQNLCNALFVDIELQVVIRIFIFMPNFLYSILIPRIANIIMFVRFTFIAKYRK